MIKIYLRLESQDLKFNSVTGKEKDASDFYCNHTIILLKNYKNIINIMIVK